jgi:hypothetical protein
MRAYIHFQPEENLMTVTAENLVGRVRKSSLLYFAGETP